MSALSNTIIAQVGAIVTPYAGKLDQASLLNLIDQITNKFVSIGASIGDSHIGNNPIEPSAHVMETASHETHQHEIGGIIENRSTLGQKTIGGRTPKGKWDLRTQAGRDGAAAESLMTGPEGGSTTVQAPQEANFPRMEPAVAIKDSVAQDKITCLHCGEKLMYLRRHLKAEHNQTIEQYKAHWNLPENYPMVAPAYAALRQKIALEQGFGRKTKVSGEAGAVSSTVPRDARTFRAKDLSGLEPAASSGKKLDGRSKEARALKAQQAA